MRPHSPRLLAALLFAFATAGSALAQNAVVTENQLPGNPQSEWDVAGAGDASIQGFATDISVAPGDTVQFKIDTPASAYRIDVYRLGWYAGLGARKVATVVPSAALPQVQPACLSDAATGLVDCGNWDVSASWAVPANAVSGVYVAKLVREDPEDGRASHVVFVVRDDTGGSKLLFQTSDTTWQAYNQYGGNSLYTGSPVGRAYKVSYNRPLTTRGATAEDSVFNAEYPMLRWLERNGYDVSYTTGVDTDRRGAELLEHRVFLSVGHDEYWSGSQRANVEAARAAGVHLAFFSGNEGFWKTRFEPSIDGSSTSHRTLVSYKETHANAKIDPEPVWTGTWRDPRPFNPEGPKPENALGGQIFTVNCCSYPMTVPEAEGKLRFWRNTSVAALAPGDVATLPADTLGYEWDEDLDNGARPPGAIRLSRTAVSVPEYLQDYGSTYAPGTATHHLSLYRAASGALVFGAGTVQWSWGLDATHDRGSNPADARMQQATVNLFADMGVQPATLQGDLVAASASTDVTPPSVTIAAPANGASVQAPVTVSGSASDGEAGVVGGVEVSLDGGATWHPAEGGATWSYALDASATGAVSVIARAVDDSGNVGAASAPVAFTVAPRSCPCSIWDDAAVPAHPYENDGQPIETGVKFRSATSGFITGVRFYKGSGNTGTHVGHLWSASGTQLAEATFTNETASGWQTVSFAQPVPIAANTTYIASSFAASGGYAFEQNYFATAHDNAPLRALADGEDGPNGVYNYGGTGFPTQNFAASNYSIDVVFETAPPSFTGFGDGYVPGNPAVSDGQPIEIGAKFQVDVAGSVTALRFYKGAANTGTHVGHLWTSAGAQLAEATFSAESASGWQEVALATPVAVAPGQTYVVSYFSASGYFAIDPHYFDAEVAAPPLRFPASSASGGNGVYLYGSSAFPSNSGNGSNYSVDVRFAPDAAYDATPPSVATVVPASGASGVAVASNVTAQFSEPLDPASVTASSFELRGPGNALVAANVSYAGVTAVLDPAAPLDPLTTYTAKVKGGAGGVTDVAGNALAADRSWSFTTAAPPPPPPDQGPGGPILVVAGSANPFGRYVAEILRNEGLNAFDVIDAGVLDSAALASHALVILGETPLSAAQATLLSNWVTGGGKLVALRPDPQLATLLGVTASAGTLANAYLKIDATQAPGAGLVADSIQFHGSADLYDLAGARAVAVLWSDAATATAHPAVTLRDVGSNGGAAAAFSYDLARSVVLTRQGNPAWAGQERDGISPKRSDDLFFGAAAGDPQPDWVDLTKVAIPQADEQQRLLANLVQTMLRDSLPMPHFWYLPNDHKAAVVLTGDEHGCCGGTRDRFNVNLAADPPGCSVGDWTCVRSTSYIYPGPGMSDAEAHGFEAQGFELATHVTSFCGDWTPSQLDDDYTTQLASFTGLFPSLAPIVTNRTHCIAWSDWASQPAIEYAHGIRFDTNYYYWPPGWVQDRPGLFTGSGLPMRFADLDGTMIDVYQSATQITDESGQTIANHAAVLLDRAQGAEGYYAVITANMHTDPGNSTSIDGAASIVAAAQARGVPVVSAKQMLTWLDGRNASSFANLAYDGSTLTFAITQAPGATHLRALLPNATAAGLLSSVRRNGQAVATSIATIKGVTYVVFDADGGNYAASYVADTQPPAISNVSATPASDGTAGVTWTTDEPADARVDYGTAPNALTSSASQAGLATSHSVALTGLAPGTTYYYRVTSADASANGATSPASPAAPASFTTPTAPCLLDASAADFAAGTTDAGARATANGVVLAQTEEQDFGGTSLPAGWSGGTWQSGGTNTVAGGVLTVDGAFAGTDAFYAPGRSLEFVATFGAQPFQHMGFGVTYNETTWAIFSTGLDGATVKARSFGASGGIDTVVGAVGAPHRYRIDWLPASVEFRIDGTLVATHANAITASMRPLASDFNAGGPTLVVDEVRMTPYVPAGRFESRVTDAGALASWGAVDWVSALPAGTSTAIAFRTGNTPVPDGSWSAFTPLATSGATAGLEGRFAQYAVDLATNDGFVTPSFDRLEAACVRQVDSDGDGLLDAHETGTGIYVSPTDTGSNAFNADSDGDGVPDGVEVARGSNPNDAGSVPAPIVGAYLFDLGNWSQVFEPAHALGVAHDGSAVVGSGDRGNGDEGFAWTLGGGLVAAGDLAGGAFASEIAAASSGGAIAVGTGTSSSGPEAVRREAGALTGLGDFAGGAFESHARDVSADGSVVVGVGTTAVGTEAFRWTANDGLVGLGHLVGGGAASDASAVSADGVVVVGTSDSVNGTEGFRWTAASGITPLGDLPGGAFASRATDVSASGIIVGVGTSAYGTEAFRWRAGKMIALGDLAGGAYASIARGVSASGDVVVGSGTTAAGEEAFVWTPATGMRRLADVIGVDFGMDLTGWDRLVSADGVSDDGRMVVGTGLRGGVPHAFVVVLDGPCSNGIDDDGDGRIDFPADLGCSSPIDASELSDCADGIDNDGDGLTDRPADPSCPNASEGARETAQCSNGVDDDGDGLIDWPNDTLCKNAWDDDEASNPACGFGAELVFVLAGVEALRRRARGLA